MTYRSPSSTQFDGSLIGMWVCAVKTEKAVVPLMVAPSAEAHMLLDALFIPLKMGSDGIEFGKSTRGTLLGYRIPNVNVPSQTGVQD